MRNILLVISFVLLAVINAFPQGCCSGGSGSPIAGGTSQGVLTCKQIELSTSFQNNSSNKFYTRDSDTIQLFKNLSSNYLYTRIAYGVTENFTMSVESGYFIDKTLKGLKTDPSYKSSGLGDLLIFPRYDIYKHSTDSINTEFTVGLGYKIPIGSHTDSSITYTDSHGVNYYSISPPTVQPTNGSQDLIFYAFYFRGYQRMKIRFFANAMYIKKGWNSLGQKFGDYASVGIFASKTILKKIGITLQVKGETIDKMQYDKKVDMLAYYNLDVKSTGGRKVSICPNIGYTYKNLTVYALTEIPVYQYWNGVQVGSQYQFTAGLSYRINL